jgi:hypothetical protein
MIAEDDRPMFNLVIERIYGITISTDSPFRPTENLAHFMELLRKLISGGDIPLHVPTETVTPREAFPNTLAIASPEPVCSTASSPYRQWDPDGTFEQAFELSKKSSGSTLILDSKVVLIAATLIFGLVLACILG